MDFVGKYTLLFDLFSTFFMRRKNQLHGNFRNMSIIWEDGLTSRMEHFSNFVRKHNLSRKRNEIFQHFLSARNCWTIWNRDLFLNSVKIYFQLFPGLFLLSEKTDSTIYLMPFFGLLKTAVVDPIC
jgi:hypothetical protein